MAFLAFKCCLLEAATLLPDLWSAATTPSTEYELPGNEAPYTYCRLPGKYLEAALREFHHPENVRDSRRRALQFCR
jgi:hypothetical protein